MRARALAASCLILLAACGAPADDAPAVVPGADATDATPQPTTPGRTLADFAGTWENTVRLEGVDEPVPSTMRGSASNGDWMMSLQGRDSIPMQVSIVGDSLVAEAAEYESILRPGVMVRVRTASVLRGDMLVGNVVATYRTPEGEQRVPGTIEGRRVR